MIPDPITLTVRLIQSKPSPYLGDTRSYRNTIRRDPCSYCGGSPSKRGHRIWNTLDHIIPESKGGRAAQNLTSACAQCNQAKSDTSLLHFLLECVT